MFKKYIDYLKDNPNKLWFKRKIFGWGWVPVRWQGWAVVAVYVALIVKIFTRIDVTSHSASDTLIGMFIPFVVLTFVLILVCYKTGEKPRWQWGIPKD